MKNPLKKSKKRLNKYLGKYMTKIITNYLPGFEVEEFDRSANYVRIGTFVVLYADDEYHEKFPDEEGQIWTHHSFDF